MKNGTLRKVKKDARQHPPEREKGGGNRSDNSSPKKEKSSKGKWIDPNRERKKQNKNLERGGDAKLPI